MKKNATWSEDELLLALYYFFRHNPLRYRVSSKENIELCNQINLLNRARYETGLIDKYVERNPNSVYMKLCNFLRLDPDYNGVGLSKGNKLEEVLWKRFTENKEDMSTKAVSIMVHAKRYAKGRIQHPKQETNITNVEVEEGGILLYTHRMLERNHRIIIKKKESFLVDHGRLCCEICGFDYEAIYGDVGKGYIECHHIVPLYKLRSISSTKATDLLLVCANCHRMLHRNKRGFSIEEIRKEMEIAIGG